MSVFSATQNLLDFCKNQGVKAIELLNNEKTGSNFVSFDKGRITARVGKNVDKLSWDLSISMFTPEDGDASLMVHLTGESSATVLDTLKLGSVEEVSNLSEV